MASSPVVSVIIPVCNVEKYLDQCLESICTQTLSELEILAIDDGSTDNSLAILEQWAVKDPRIRVISKTNEGYGATCNRGLNEARAPWVSIIEPDDWIDRDMYRAMIQFASSFDVTIDVVKTPWFDWYDWDNPRTAHRTLCTLAGRLPTSKWPFTLAEKPLLIEGHPSIWSALYNRVFLNSRDIRFIPYPGAGWADNPFLIESLAEARTIVYLDKAFYNYRCELPKKKVSKNSEAMAMPFDRWMTMLALLEKAGVANRPILEAHYLRGFNYADNAIREYGPDNPLVGKKIKQIFSLMNPEIVYWHPKLRDRRKRFYQKVTGNNQLLLPNPRRTQYLINESLFQFRNRGGLLGLKSHIKKFIDNR